MKYCMLQEIEGLLEDHLRYMQLCHDDTQYFIRYIMDNNWMSSVNKMFDLTQNPSIKLGKKVNIDLLLVSAFKHRHIFRKLNAIILSLASSDVSNLAPLIVDKLCYLRQLFMQCNVHMTYFASFREMTVKVLRDVELFQLLEECFSAYPHSWACSSLGLISGFLSAFCKGRISPLLSEQGYFRSKYQLKLTYGHLQGHKYLTKEVLESLVLNNES